MTMLSLDRKTLKEFSIKGCNQFRYIFERIVFKMYESIRNNRISQPTGAGADPGSPAHLSVSVKHSKTSKHQPSTQVTSPQCCS